MTEIHAGNFWTVGILKNTFKFLWSKLQQRKKTKFVSLNISSDLTMQTCTFANVHMNASVISTGFREWATKHDKHNYKQNKHMSDNKTVGSLHSDSYIKFSQKNKNKKNQDSWPIKQNQIVKVGNRLKRVKLLLQSVTNTSAKLPMFHEAHRAWRSPGLL